MVIRGSTRSYSPGNARTDDGTDLPPRATVPTGALTSKAFSSADTRTDIFLAILRKSRSYSSIIRGIFPPLGDDAAAGFRAEAPQPPAGAGIVRWPPFGALPIGKPVEVQQGFVRASRRSVWLATMACRGLPTTMSSRAVPLLAIVRVRLAPGVLRRR